MAIWFGVDIGGTRVKTALINSSGAVQVTRNMDTHADRGSENLCRRLAQTLQDLSAEVGISPDSVPGVGVGVPAFLEGSTGFLVEAPNLRWRNIPLADHLTAALQRPVIVENDANVASLGEAWTGAGAGAESVLCVTVGTGVGGGIVLDGRLHRGVSGMAGEIGHLRIDLEHPLACTCGLSGCLETRASATAIIREARALQATGRLPAEPPIHGAAQVYRLAAEGNREAQAVVETAGTWLGYGLALAAGVLNPAVIVLGGGVAAAGDALLQPVKRAFTANAVPRTAQTTAIEMAKLGNQAGAVGAARLAMQHVAQVQMS